MPIVLNKTWQVTPSTTIIDFYKKPSKTTHNLAYLAGLIDGEGYLKIEKWGTIRLIIGMCSKKTIYWIKNNFGGSVHIQKTAKGKNFYVWRLNQGKDLFYLLLLVLPFLVNKKKLLADALIKMVKKFEQDKNILKLISHIV